MKLCVARPRGSCRGLIFRLLAIGLGLAPLAASEAIIRVFDVGRPSALDDPFVGFSSTRPLFELSRDGTRYEIAPAHKKFFQRDGFTAVKPPDEFRIFCLGGSTVQGRPFSIETSFTTWLELSLRAAEPGRRWRVVNCGGVSYATYREALIVDELLRYQPDLFIVCTGHNEFLEDRSYAHLRESPVVVRAVLEQASRLRTFELLALASARLVNKLRGPARDNRTRLGAEVEAVLDYEGGLASYHRNDRWRRGVIAHFRYNLRRMVDRAHEAGVAVILVNPAANLETPPFKSEHRAGISAEELHQFERLQGEASKFYGKSLTKSVAFLKQAIDLDDQHAGIHFALGKCYEALGGYRDARDELVRAKDLDICPLRILEPMKQAILDTPAPAEHRSSTWPNSSRPEAAEELPVMTGFSTTFIRRSVRIN